MKFRRASEYHGVSECGRYTICRSPGVYTAVRNGKPDALLRSVRFADDSERETAWREAVRVCEEDARG